MSYKYYDDDYSPLGLLIGIIILVVICFSSCVLREINEREVTVTVTEKGIKNYKNRGLYLIYCKDATDNVSVYKIEDSLMQGKFNSSDIYASIETGKTYTFLIRGIRNEITSNYPNIVRIINVEKKDNE